MANVYDLALKISGKVDKSLNNSTKSAQGELEKLKRAGKLAGLAVAAGLAAAGAAAVAGAKKMIELGAAFDKAYDAIRIGTGATGEDLQALKGDFKEVFATVPTTMENASKAIADYNTRLGLTGEELQGVSKQAIQASAMLGEDLGTVIENSSKAFQQWGVPAGEMSEKMDFLFKVSQSTGTGFSELAGNVQLYGAQLQGMGYNFEQAAVLVGQLDKAGVNTNEVLQAMKKSTTELAKKGISASDGLRDYISKIKGAGTATEATAIATEIFGTRAASTMSAAIRSGALDVDGLTASLLANSETIAGAAGATYSFSEKLQIFKNKAQVALEPMAMTLFDSLEILLPVIGAALETVTGAFNGVCQEIGKFIQYVKDSGGILATVKKFYEEHRGVILAVTYVVGTLTAALLAYNAGAIASAVATNALAIAHTVASVATWAFGAAMAFLTSPITLVVLGIAALVAAAWVLVENWDSVKAFILDCWETVRSFLAGVWDGICAGFQRVGEFFLNIYNSYIAPVVDMYISTFNGILDFVSNIFAGNWGAAWQNIVDIFGTIFGTIGNFVKAPINAIISAVNYCIDAVNGMGITIPDWVPVIGGKGFSLDIPKVPMLAQGGVVSAPTLAMIGEGTESEAVMPLSKLDGMVRDASTNTSTANITFAPVINVTGSAPAEAVKTAVDDAFERFKALMQRYEQETRRKSFSY